MVERAGAKEKMQSYKHRPKKIRREGMLSLISDRRIIEIRVTEEIIDTVPPTIVGVIKRALI